MAEKFLEIPWIPAAVAALYLLKKKKTAGEIIEKIVKLVIGWYLILLGAGLSLNVLGGLEEKLVLSLGIHGGVINTEIFGSWLLMECRNAGFTAFLIAFLVNLLLAKWTRRGYLFLTGHHLLFLSLMSLSLIRVFLGEMSVGAVLLAGTAAGIYAYISVRISAAAIKPFHSASPVSLANSAAGAALLGAGIGKLCSRGKISERFDKKGKNTGHITSMGVLTVFCIAFILTFLQGVPELAEMQECLVEAFLYGAALTAIMQGLRMFLGLFIQMFWDLGKEMIPGLVVGLDSTAVISWSPGAWHAGFLAAALTGVVTVSGLVFLKVPFVPLPGFTSLYFAGGVAGVFGNVQGGKRGAILAGAASGIAVILLLSLFMSLNEGMGLYGASLGETEYGILGLILTALLRLFN